MATEAFCAVHSTERRRVRSVAEKAAALPKLAKQIESGRRCRRGGIGKAVVGEGWLRRAIRGIGLDEHAVYLTSPMKYRPWLRKPTAADVAHGRMHLRQQIDIINPEIIVLLGSTACLGVLNEKR